MKWVDYKERYAMQGWFGLLTGLCYALINRFCYFDHLCLMTLSLSETDPAYMQDLPGFHCGFMNEEMIRQFAQDVKYQLSSEFLSGALANGDACYGIRQGQDLCSYGWYSTQPTAVTADFKIHIPPEYVYMHHGYTNPKFRGQRLHAFGMAYAVKHYTDQKFQGLISIVGGENIASLKSTHRLGYRLVGRIYLFACMNRYFVYHDRGTRRMNACLSPLRSDLKSFRNGSHPDHKEAA